MQGGVLCGNPVESPRLRSKVGVTIRMNLRFHASLLLAGLLALTSCGLLRRAGKSSPKEGPLKGILAGEQALGTVNLTNRAGAFILINTRYASSIADGTELISKNASVGQTGRLRASRERNKNAFLIADVTDGNPGIGDLVYVLSKNGETGAPALEKLTRPGEEGDPSTAPLPDPATQPAADLPPLSPPSADPAPPPAAGSSPGLIDLPDLPE